MRRVVSRHGPLSSCPDEQASHAFFSGPVGPLLLRQLCPSGPESRRIGPIRDEEQERRDRQFRRALDDAHACGWVSTLFSEGSGINLGLDPAP